MASYDERFVITGQGTVNSIGHNAESTYKAALNEKKETKDITSWDIRNDPALSVFRANECVLEDLTDREYKRWPKLTKAAFLATKEAVEQSGFSSHRVATIISSIGGGNDSRWDVESNYFSGKKKSNPFTTLGISYDYSSSAISAVYGWNGPSTVLVSACASGIYSIDYGIKCIMAGDCDYAVVGGTDMMADRYNMYFFQVLNALSKRDDPYISQPFSKERDGFVMGEGAGIFVIERMSNALSRGATILAEIKGIGFYTESNHPTSPSTDGIGAFKAAQLALERSGIKRVDFISAHATSTPIGDKIEYEAMNRILPDTYITSAKGHLGHTMSASSIIESIIGIGSMNNNLIHPVGNFTSSDLNGSLKIVKHATSTPINSFIKNSYGFGGKCTSIVYAKHI